MTQPITDIETPERVAEQAANQIADLCLLNDDANAIWYDRLKAKAIIAAALRAERERVLEEAVRAIQGIYCMRYDDVKWISVTQAEEAIRALAQKGNR